MSDGDGKQQLGKILLRRKIVSARDLDNILHEQADSGGERLASKVLEKGLTDETKLLRALSEQAGVPAVNLDDVEVSLENLEIVPHEIAAQHVIMPVSISADSINLAMANPDDQRVIDEIEFVSGKKVFPHVALHAQIVKFVEACYRAKAAGETVYRSENFGKRPAETDLTGFSGTTETSGVRTVLGPAADGASDELSLEIDFDFEDMPVAPAEPEPVIAAPTTGLRKKKILVVDDEDDIRLLISRVLTDKGYNVVTAGRGLEAIKLVQTEKPDMIILDAMLPEVHGFDICKKIKGSKKYGHIPVIMISAIYRGWRYAQDLRDSYGVDDFMEKPFKISEFVEKVEKHLSREPMNLEDPEDLSSQAEKVLEGSVEAYRKGKIDEAIALLKTGLEIDPLAFKLHYNLALLLGKKALNYQAIRELESALELAPGYFPALKNLALLYQKAGFKFKAVETWERALHHCPEDETKESIKRHLMSLL